MQLRGKPVGFEHHLLIHLSFMEEKPNAVCGALSKSLRVLLLFSYARNRDHFFSEELIWSVKKVTRVSRGYVNNGRPRGDKSLCYFCVVYSLGNRASGRICLFPYHSLASFSVLPFIRSHIYRWQISRFAFMFITLIRTLLYTM